MKRFLQLLILFFLFSILVDFNEESVFVAGAFLTWFLLFEAIAGALHYIINKELTDEFYSIKTLLEDTKEAYNEISLVIGLIYKNIAFVTTLLINLHTTILLMGLVNMITYSESKTYVSLWGLSSSDLNVINQELGYLNFVYAGLPERSNANAQLLFC